MQEQPEIFQMEHAKVRVFIKRLNPAAPDDAVVTVIPNEGPERVYFASRDLFDYNEKVANRIYAQWLKENNIQ